MPKYKTYICQDCIEEFKGNEMYKCFIPAGDLSYFGIFCKTCMEKSNSDIKEKLYEKKKK